MTLLDEAENFLWRVAAKKAIARGVQLFCAYAIAHGAENFGVSLNPEAMTIAVMAGLEGLRNFLKVKRGWDFLP